MQSQSVSQVTVSQAIENLDSFGRQRFSNPVVVFASKQILDKQPLVWDDQLISGAGGASTFNANLASTTLSVANLTAGYRARQTFQRINYQAGKSQLVIMGLVVGLGAAGIEKRWGLFDGKDPFSNNGIFWRQNGTTLQVGTINRGTTSELLFNQANFNIDKLDGTGPSGFNLRVENINKYVIDFQWSGVVRFGVVVGTKIVYCHEIDRTNTETQVFMATPNLPLRVEISNDGTGPASSITHIDGVVISEGGAQDINRQFSVDRGFTGLVTLASTNLYPLVAVRLKSGFQSANIDIKSINILSDTVANFRWALLLNPTVTGTAFSFSGITNSAVEADAARTNATTVSGGTLIASGYAITDTESVVNTAFPNKIQLGNTIAGVSDIIVLAVQTNSAIETFYGELSWNEVI